MDYHVELQISLPWTCSKELMLHNRNAIRHHYAKGEDFVSAGHTEIKCDGEGDNFCTGKEDHNQYRGYINVKSPV